MERLVQIADQLIALCHVDTPWEIALGAAAVAAITGDAERSALLLEGWRQPPFFSSFIAL
jgi:hypothetical protein